MAILTLARQHGSSSREFGKEIARELGYEFIDRERLLQDIRPKGKEWENYEKDFEEHRPSLWEKYDWSFRGFVALQQSMIFNYAIQDNVLIMGRGANFLLKEIPYVLKARIEAPLDARIEIVQNRESVDRSMAQWMIEKLDKQYDGFIRAVYDANWSDHANYDLVFNTAVQSDALIIASLKEALKERESRKTEDAVKLLKMKAAAKGVKAGILTNSKLFVPTLDVTTDGETITLRGIVHNPKERKTVEDEARRLAGDISIKCELHYR
jgi:cytidylate kinase